ncbi:MAG: acetylglutamate kinase [Gammaproteobacteria bacterium]|nr:acetylglutamate kinase [Gammaproteobacteria bacterium]
MPELKSTTQVLVEALPYIQRFQHANIVVKYGGAAMEDEQLKTAFALDIVFMKMVGMNPIVVHGGGPQIGQMLSKLNIPTKFIDGIRVTDGPTMDVVQMVLGGLVNQQIVSLIHAQGGRAVGLTGKDGAFIRANKMVLSKQSEALSASEIIDIGHVGQVAQVDSDLLRTMFDSKYVPVIAPIGIGPDGESYNINADHVASAVATAIKAEKLIFLTNTPGILDQAGETIPEMTQTEINHLVADGTISEGMLPKTECAIEAINASVEAVQIIDGRIPHALLLELLTDAGVGTLIKSDLPI